MAHPWQRVRRLADQVLDRHPHILQALPRGRKARGGLPLLEGSHRYPLRRGTATEQGLSSMRKRRTHSPEFKAKVSMEAISGRQTIQEISAYGAERLIRVTQDEPGAGRRQWSIHGGRKSKPWRQQCNGLVD